MFKSSFEGMGKSETYNSDKPEDKEQRNGKKLMQIN